MTVLIDLTSLSDNFSGIERFALCITKELIKNTTIKYILVFKNEVHNDFSGAGNNVETIVLKGSNKLWFNQVILPLKLLAVRADYYLFLAFPAPLLFFSRKSISAIHDMGCWDCPQTNKKHMVVYFRILYRKASMRNKKIITVSDFSKERIISILRVKEDNVQVIHNGIAEVFSEFKYEADRHEFVKKKYALPEKYILCLSTIEPRKNMKLLIRAFCKLVEKYPLETDKLELVLAGRKGWLTEQLLDAIPNEIKTRMHFTGFVEDTDLPYIYVGAQLFVFPSIYEGFGIPPLEALVCETEVISSNVSSMPEILENYAYYFESENEEHLVTKMYDVLFSKDKNTKIIPSQEILDKYNWHKEANKLMDMLIACKD